MFTINLMYLCIGVFFLIPFAHSEVWNKKNDPQIFLPHDVAYESQIFELDRKVEKEIKLAEDQQPWSGYHWPFLNGSIALRYTLGLPGYKSFEEQYNRYRQKFDAGILESRSINVVNLSAAEKYDLLISPGGTVDWFLTQSVWEDSKRVITRARANGESINGWHGICEGHSLASLIYPRPTKSIEVKNAEGVAIKFFPEDLKALSSYFEAKKYDRPLIILGDKCKLDHPQTEGRGRVIAPDCFDTNPGAWHIAATLMLGAKDNKRAYPFVADLDNNLMVWNHVVVGYEFHYFHPITREKYQTLWNQNVPNLELIQKLKKDNLKDKNDFHAYHDRRAQYIIGVQMDLFYSKGDLPNAREAFSIKEDRIGQTSYSYFLELDKDYKIIGGEWQWNNRPDFIWRPSDQDYQKRESNITTNSLNDSGVMALAVNRARFGAISEELIWELFNLAK